MVNIQTFLFVIIICIFNEHFAATDDITNSTNSRELIKCYPQLGCVEYTADWYDPKNRPKNLEPLERHTIKTTFMLYSNMNDTEKQNANKIGKQLEYEIIIPRADVIAISKYKSGKKLILLIHDFTSSGYTGWIKNMAKVYLHKGAGNIVVVDWEGGAEPPYLQAVSNARVVALETIELFKVLRKDFSLRGQDIHIIGHGIGAHIAGYIGDIENDISRITGLDPSGPYFEDMPLHVRLDSSDASFVEVVHTDSDPTNDYHEGVKENIGHVDFYVNNGKLQPGCNRTSESIPNLVSLTRNDIKQGDIYPGCSHKRAFKYYMEAVLCDACEFIGYQCESWQRYLEGLCTSCQKNKQHIGCLKLGKSEHTSLGNLTGIKLYLKTGSIRPFCLQMYKMVLQLARPDKARESVKGYFQVLIVAEINSEVVTVTLENETAPDTYFHGKNKTLVIFTSTSGVSELQELKLKWFASGNMCIGCNTAIYVETVTVSHIKYKESTKNENIETTLCSSTGHTNEIKSGNVGSFIKCTSRTKEPEKQSESTLVGVEIK